VRFAVRRRVRVSWVVLLAILGTLLLVALARGSAAAAAPSPNPKPQTLHPVVDLITINGAIDPMNAQYVTRALQRAAGDHAQAALVEMNTPGGLDSSMREITGAMLTSPVPIVLYVTPAGARAGSAGVFIMMAADVAAMAPGTNVGAAHPVSGDGSGTNLPNDERTKVTNDAAAYMRTLATTRDHNAVWAEEAVRQSVALAADEALQQKVINLISPDRATLLSQVDGMAYTRDGKTFQLQTRGAVVDPIAMTVPEQLLHLLDDPNISYLLLSIGGWALLAELFHPGSVIPGVVGVVCLALALTAFESLPLNWTGVGLIVIALALFVVDLHAPSHGVLTAGGLVTFVFGSLMLFSPVDLPVVTASPFALGVNPLLVFGIGIGLTAFFAVAVRATLLARHRPAMAIGSAVIGATGLAVTDLAPSGSVRIQGTEWKADAEGKAIRQGDPVQITSRTGLRLVVRQLDPNRRGEVGPATLKVRSLAPFQQAALTSKEPKP